MLRLKDLMQRDVVSVSPDLTLRELLEVLTEQEVSGAPVVANGVVVGVISTTDIFDFREDAPGVSLRPGGPLDERAAGRRDAGNPSSEFFAESWEPGEVEALEWMRTTHSPEWDLLNGYSVGEVMTRQVISQPSSTPLKKAAAYMLEAGVHRVLVIDEGELRGIVTTTDILRALAEGKLKG